ncbi:hypothetical protein [Streptomyces sp. ODS28]|uniref:hypothetical protein n=1 Tax=Streptomyces sp. ODS28 TaxID=3136688 RepID=UPI0031F0A546
MILEALGAAALGLGLAYAAAHRLPARFAHRGLVLGTGPAAALLGCIVSRVVLGPGYAAVTLAVAAAVSIAILSLLLRDARPHPSSTGLPANVAGPPRV